MSVDLDERTYIRELEDSLQLILFGDGGNATAVVLLVRSALSAGDLPKAERLVSAAQHLTEATLVKSDMDAAACHVRGLIERNADLLQQAADQYAAPLACALAQGAQGHQQAERRIVELVAQGLSNRQVAGQVFLSVHTVAYHLWHVFWKLDVSSRVQLARLAASRARRQVVNRTNHDTRGSGLAAAATAAR